MTERVEVRRNRQWRAVAALVGMLLLVFGIIFLGPGEFAIGDTQLMAPPETDAQGNLTLLGQRERRADLVWGIVFAGTGAALLAAGLAGLRRRPVVAAVDEDGLELSVRGPMRDPLILSWDAIRDVHTAWDEDETGQVRALVVEVFDPRAVPERLWGARHDGDRIVVDARRWIPAPEVIADYASFALHDRRRQTE